jgi:hypothetical protein
VEETSVEERPLRACPERSRRGRVTLPFGQPGSSPCVLRKVHYSAACEAHLTRKSLWTSVSSVMVGLGFNDFAAAQAGRADADALPLTADFRVHRTQVDVPAPLGDIVRVADAVSRLRLLAADITLLCHDDSQKIQYL